MIMGGRTKLPDVVEGARSTLDPKGTIVYTRTPGETTAIVTGSAHGRVP